MKTAVQLIGEPEHPDFCGVVQLLRAEAQFVDAASRVPPQLIVVAKSRPGAVGIAQVMQSRRHAPLAGVVALLGSWCEGESRTGRPWPGVARLYWYEFPAWWRRQTTLIARGRCPDWARPMDADIASQCEIRNPKSEIRNPSNGVVVLSVPSRDTREALADVLRNAGYATVWHRTRGSDCEVRGAAAGIWDGGQLDEREADDLAMFCRRLSRDAAPVVALLDFPRRDRMQRAMELGAAAVLGKPWRNDALLTTLEAFTTNAIVTRAA